MIPFVVDVFRTALKSLERRVEQLETIETVLTTALLGSIRIPRRVLDTCGDDSGDHRVKLKEREKKDKYQDLARELKKKTVDHKIDV